MALVLVAALVAVVVSSGDDGSEADRAGASRQGGGGSAPPAAGREERLLDGRLVFVAPAGWEVSDSTADTATIRAQLREGTGRELISTVVTSFLAGEGPFDVVLDVSGGTRFTVNSASGTFEAVAAADGGRVIAGAARPSGRYLVTLTVYAMDGQGLDVALLQKLFTEQVAPQFRFP